jgi:hypothetical protein
LTLTFLRSSARCLGHLGQDVVGGVLRGGRSPFLLAAREADRADFVFALLQCQRIQHHIWRVFVSMTGLQGLERQTRDYRHPGSESDDGSLFDSASSI